MTNKVVKTDEEWRAILTPEQYRVLRAKGTEPAFCGLLWDHKEAGDYVCVGCGQVIFSSTNKFHSSSGWPSFWAPVSRDALTTEIDRKFGMVRTEVLCSRCGGHLGHVFDDGPKPTGLRYCINSVAMKFEPKQSD